jgi:SAM-dependent methyltransferase
MPVTTPLPPLPAPLSPGLVRAPGADALAATATHAGMGAYADEFRARHPDRVSLDPFRQWSRTWEYPFALDALRRHLPAEEPSRILEAGSGFTFFPYLLAELMPGARITCVDGDPALAEGFREARDEAPEAVAFRPGRLEDLPDEDGAYDAVACLSVLEHVDEPAPVLRELHRVLRPGGLLVVTFDIAPDGDYAIPVPGAERVLDALAALFPGAELPHRGRLAEAVREPDVLTTRVAARRDPTSMPWTSPLMSTLGSLRHGFLPRSYGWRKLTVWCGALRRPEG